MMAGVTRPPTVRATIASPNSRPRVCRIDPWVDAGDHEQSLVGKERKAWRVAARVAGREGGVASEQRIDVGHVRRSVRIRLRNTRCI